MGGRRGKARKENGKNKGKTWKGVDEDAKSKRRTERRMIKGKDDDMNGNTSAYWKVFAEINVA